MEDHQILFILLGGVVTFIAGVGIKIVYDFLKYKAPPRDAPDHEKFPEKYDPDICALKHNTIDSNLSILKEEDSKNNTCLNHIKSKVHGLEIVTTEHHQKLETDDRRLIHIESCVGEMKKDYRQIREQQQEIKGGIKILLDRVQ